jgi:protein tyrosine phosphatase
MSYAHCLPSSYANIVPFDVDRVVLHHKKVSIQSYQLFIKFWLSPEWCHLVLHQIPNIVSFQEGDASDYINASWVKGTKRQQRRFIATQG